MKKSLTQLDLIDTQLSQNSQGGSSDGVFVRGRTFEKGSTCGGGNKGKGKSKSRGPNKNKTCNYCKLKGHIKKDCWKWKKKKKNASDDGARDATSNADASYVNDNDDGGVLVATHGYKDSDEWILDSRCTFHMTPNKNFFQTCER